VPDDLAAVLREVYAPRASFSGGTALVNHRQRQAPLGMMRAGSFEQWGYCAHKMVTIRELIPTWEDLLAVPAGEGARSALTLA
jgi:hypothetical protein